MPDMCIVTPKYTDLKCGKPARFTVNDHRVCARHLAMAVERLDPPGSGGVLVSSDFYDSDNL